MFICRVKRENLLGQTMLKLKETSNEDATHRDILKQPIKVLFEGEPG